MGKTKKVQKVELLKFEDGEQRQDLPRLTFKEVKETARKQDEVFVGQVWLFKKSRYSWSLFVVVPDQFVYFVNFKDEDKIAMLKQLFTDLTGKPDRVMAIVDREGLTLELREPEEEGYIWAGYTDGWKYEKEEIPFD